MFSVIKIIFEFLIFFSSKSLLSVAARWLWRRQATEKFGSASTVYLRLKHAGVNHVEMSFLVFYTTISSTRACGGWTELYRIWPWDRMRMLAFLNTRGMTNNRIRDSAPETEKRTTKKRERRVSNNGGKDWQKRVRISTLRTAHETLLDSVYRIRLNSGAMSRRFNKREVII